MVRKLGEKVFLCFPPTGVHLPSDVEKKPEGSRRDFTKLSRAIG